MKFGLENTHFLGDERKNEAGVRVREKYRELTIKQQFKGDSWTSSTASQSQHTQAIYDM